MVLSNSIEDHRALSKLLVYNPRNSGFKLQVMCHTVKRFRLFNKGNQDFQDLLDFAWFASGSIKGTLVGILDRELLTFRILDKDMSEMHGS